MSHDLQQKPKKAIDSSSIAKEEQPDLSSEFETTTASFFLQNTAAPPPSTQSILQLQRTVGNQATTQLLSRQMKPDLDSIQRWPEWLDKLVGKGKYQKIADEPADDDGDAQEQISKLEQIKEKLQPWAQAYAIHTNYQKYASLIGKKAWKTAMKVWEYVNKVLNVVSNLDPSGITKAIAQVSKLIKMLAGYVTEAYDMLTDSTLVEQLTPLLEVSIVDMVVGSIKEIKSIWDAGSSAWEAVEALI